MIQKNENGDIGFEPMIREFKSEKKEEQIAAHKELTPVPSEDAARALRNDAEYQELISSKAYRNKYDPLHSSTVNRVQQLTMFHVENTEELANRPDPRYDTDLLRAVDSYIPGLREELRGIQFEGQRMTQDSVNKLVALSAKDAALPFNRDQAKELLKIIESHPKRYSTKIADRKISSGLSVISLKLREVITKGK